MRIEGVFQKRGGRSKSVSTASALALEDAEPPAFGALDSRLNGLSLEGSKCGPVSRILRKLSKFFATSSGALGCGWGSWGANVLVVGRLAESHVLFGARRSGNRISGLCTCAARMSVGRSMATASCTRCVVNARGVASGRRRSMC